MKFTIFKSPFGHTHTHTALSLLTVFALLFFTFSCSRDGQEALPNADENRNVNLYATPDENLVAFEEEGEMVREGCHCYMQVLSAENIVGNVGGSQYEYEWGLVDATSVNSGDMEIDGKGTDKWRENASQPWKMLPTPFFELDEPSFGTHMFYSIFSPISSSELEPLLASSYILRSNVKI